MNLTITEKSYAWYSGHDSFYRGMISSDNPYKENTIRYADWFDGWIEAADLNSEKDE